MENTGVIYRAAYALFCFKVEPGFVFQANGAREDDPVAFAFAFTFVHLPISILVYDLNKHGQIVYEVKKSHFEYKPGKEHHPKTPKNPMVWAANARHRFEVIIIGV
ncbi:MAG: hypothetical protein IPH04_17385 [Saprospirales bacterium]|nr:hypothetical protein [Saprospirales bacterium]